MFEMSPRRLFAISYASFYCSHIWQLEADLSSELRMTNVFPLCVFFATNQEFTQGSCSGHKQKTISGKLLPRLKQSQTVGTG
jgi:hypothetical protein